MRGDLSSDEFSQGIIQRSVLHLFRRLAEHDYSDVHVAASFLEIYNEELEDLFFNSSVRGAEKKTLVLVLCYPHQLFSF